MTITKSDSVKNKLGQLFKIGISGKELTPEESDFILKNNIGGVVLFARNLEGPKQIHSLCQSIQSLHSKQADKAPILISIDMEGGRVHRLKPPFTQWPALNNLGKLDSTSLAFKLAQSMGQELISVGINMDFAPCVDTLTNLENKVIGDRAISGDPEQVAKIASALVRGYIKAGIIPCAKHFPGHGNTLLDSHEDLPIEELSYEELSARELIPFKKVFRARLDFVMTAHIKFPKIDPDYPVTMSKKFIQDIIRKDLRYRGLVISDDLDMRALRNNYEVEDIAVKSMAAGCDMLLYCNEADTPPRGLDAVLKAIDSGVIEKSQVEASYQKVMELKKARFTSEDSATSFDDASKIIGHPDHLRLAKAIASLDVPEDLLTGS